MPVTGRAVHARRLSPNAPAVELQNEHLSAPQPRAKSGADALAGTFSAVASAPNLLASPGGTGKECSERRASRAIEAVEQSRSHTLSQDDVDYHDQLKDEDQRRHDPGRHEHKSQQRRGHPEERTLLRLG